MKTLCVVLLFPYNCFFSFLGWGGKRIQEEGWEFPLCFCEQDEREVDPLLTLFFYFGGESFWRQQKMEEQAWKREGVGRTLTLPLTDYCFEWGGNYFLSGHFAVQSPSNSPLN